MATETTTVNTFDSNNTNEPVKIKKPRKKTTKPKIVKPPKVKKNKKELENNNTDDTTTTCSPNLKATNETVIPKDALENKATEIGRFWSVDKPLTHDAIELLKKLIPFFNYATLENLIVPRSIKSLGLAKQYHMPDHMKADINGISLRAIEWLVTYYSKGTKIVLFHEELKRRVDIHRAYENHSSYFKRNLFDPFCRHDKIYFLWRLRCVKTNELKNVILLTTVGQLNFMKWAHEHGVLAYAKAHQTEIQNDMERTLSVVNKEKKQYKAAGKRRKRKELTKSPNICCTVYGLQTTLHFDHFDSPASSPELGPVQKKVCVEKNGKQEAEEEEEEKQETFLLDGNMEQDREEEEVNEQKEQKEEEEDEEEEEEEEQEDEEEEDNNQDNEEEEQQGRLQIPEFLFHKGDGDNDDDDDDEDNVNDDIIITRMQ
jgi:hypothetical protein